MVSETAEQLIDLAEAHIRNAGYGGFSFRDLAAEIGIKSASVHHGHDGCRCCPALRRPFPCRSRSAPE